MSIFILGTRRKCVTCDDETIEQVVYKLSNDSQEDAFDSLRTIVELITNAESQILPEYKQTDAVFNNVKMDIESYVLRKGIVEDIGKSVV